MTKPTVPQVSNKSLKARSNDDVEVLKIILDANPELKKKVIRFMQKNYIKNAQKDVK